MRKLALVVSSALILAAIVFVSPVAAAKRPQPPSRPPAPPHTKALVQSEHPVAPPTRAARPTAATPYTVTCDGAFDTVPSPNAINNNYLAGLAVISANDVWAVGNTHITGNAFGDKTLAEHWDGTSWTIFGTPSPGSFSSGFTGVAAISASNVWAVGLYQIDNSGVDFATFAAHWNGSSWSQDLTTVNPGVLYSGFFGATADPAGNVWAVGTWWNGANYQPLAEEWNGASWSNKSAAFVGTKLFQQLFSVSAWSASDIWAVGSIENTLISPLQTLAEHYDGVSWTVQTSTNTSSSDDNEIFGVLALEANHAEGVGYGGFVGGSTPRKSIGFELKTGMAGTQTILSGIPGAGSGDNLLNDIARIGAKVQAVGFSRASLAAPRLSLAVPATWDAPTHLLTWSTPGTSADPSATNNDFFAVRPISQYAFWASGYETSGSNVDQTFTALFCGLRMGLSAPATTTAGSTFSLTLTAKNPDGSTATGYVGTVHFTNTLSGATLPADYTFVTGDAGVHTFTGVVLTKTFYQTITAADTVTPFVAGSATVYVYCLGACQSATAPPAARPTTSQGGAGTVGSRGGTQQSPPGNPRPRIPVQILTSGRVGS